MIQRQMLPLHVLAGKGVAAGGVKLASAALTFAVFVVVAATMDERQFGLFSTAYAGASLVSFFALAGQHAAVLRFWPQYAGSRDHGHANSIMALSIRITAVAVIGCALIVSAASAFPLLVVPEWPAIIAATALLAAALGWSEFCACAMRAKGALFSSLLPRDIVWRVLSILVFVIAGHLATSMTAVSALWLTALLLIASVLPQTVTLLRETWRAPKIPLSPAQKAEFRAATLGLWGVTALPPALGQASTLVVAALLGPETAGAVFVADRITRLAALALNGINQAAAPQISGAFHGGDRPHVQHITSFVAVTGFTAALAVLAGLIITGHPVLALFDPAYATPTMHSVLVILGLGVLIGTACGPTELTMQLTGLQRELFRTLVFVNGLGLAATAALALTHGPMGAAIGMAGTTAVWCLAGAAITRRKIGIDPSILGFLSGRRLLALNATQKGRP
ncbi:lipopolysaccharide biosynthesis protein (plasmid) [Shinella sp. H4-D48]|uniref:lipopolysaccharide biosynthesis protein n=1 Tax=Shinella sp. H4-D48 TaxID=2925841 RepID=UPI001F5306FF|nr:lipopolysaccharide biosynthesis protein [Shinella sp. H4-D48]UNK40283.1 lipopolysaccharide biosynthesis protein [Shinella sp. H4-D48]